MTIFLVVVAFLLVLGVGVKLYDLKRKREAEAVALQAQISDALLRDASMAAFTVTPMAKASGLRRTPVVVELRGTVDSPEQRETALTIARSEAARVHPDAQIDDRMTLLSRRAA